MNSSKRLVWVDNVKIIACILVVLGHLLQSFLSAQIIAENELSLWFLNTVYLFHVPLFFICSGYLYEQFSAVNSASSYGKSILKKLLSLGIPYFVFSFITWLLKTVFSGSVNHEANGLVETLFVSPSSPYWYLYILFFIFVITPTVANKASAFTLLCAALIFKAVCVCGISFNIYFIDKLFENEIWFVLGIMISYFKTERLFEKKSNLITALFMMSAFFAGSALLKIHNFYPAALSFLLGLIMCYAVISVVFYIYRSNNRTPVLSFAAKYTLPVFLMHTIFAAATRALLFKLGISSPAIHIAAGIVISFAGPIIAGLIMDKVKYLDFVLYPLKYIKITNRKAK